MAVNILINIPINIAKRIGGCMAKLIVELPDDLKLALKLRAVQDNTTIREVVTELVQRYLREREDGQMPLWDLSSGSSRISDWKGKP
jgi:predicted RNA-binding protein (virulence factor B family)